MTTGPGCTLFLGLTIIISVIDLVKPAYLSWHAPCDPSRDQKGFPGHVSCGVERYLVCSVILEAMPTCECVHPLMTWDPDASKVTIDQSIVSIKPKGFMNKRKQKFLSRFSDDDGKEKGACRFRQDGPCTQDSDCFSHLKCREGGAGKLGVLCGVTRIYFYEFLRK